MGTSGEGNGSVAREREVESIRSSPSHRPYEVRRTVLERRTGTGGKAFVERETTPLLKGSNMGSTVDE